MLDKTVGSMLRTYLKALLVFSMICLLAGVVLLRLNIYKLGTGIVGGTILVYEVDLERTRQRTAGMIQQDVGSGGKSSPSAGLSREEMNQLAMEIQRRIDPTDIKNVAVRPLGNDRIEIV